MPPLVETGDQSLSPSLELPTPWLIVFVLAGLGTLILTISLCACGGGKKEKEPEPAVEGAEDKGTQSKGKKTEGKEKLETGGETGNEGGKEAVGGAYLDLSKPGLPAEEKKRIAVAKKGVDEANPAYQTLVHQSKFEASTRGSSKTKGLPPPPTVPDADTRAMSKVVGTNPAYQTLLNNSEFEASKQAAPKSMMKTAMPGTTMKGATEKK